MQPEKKYFKRGDLAEAQAKEYNAIHAPKMAPQPEELPDEQPETKSSDKEVAKKITMITFSREQVISKLRDAFQPILLFGETDEEANLRLNSLEYEVSDKLGGTSQNDYREAMKRVDQQYLKHMNNSEENPEEKNSFESKLYSTDKTYEDLLDMVHDIQRGDLKHDDLVISEWIKVIMTMWAKELNSKDDAERTSIKGRMELTTFSQTKAYVKPLLKLLKKNKLTDDIRDSLSNMIKFVLQRDYIIANERYMEMAIGNAPWPIGVTNAGIHARPGRERIFSKHVAHVLNDESQRKYIQGLKRLMTKAQIYFVTDPSRSVDFIREGAPEDTETSTGDTVEPASST